MKAWEKGQRGKGDYERWRGKFRSKGEVHELCRKGGGRSKRGYKVGEA